MSERVKVTLTGKALCTFVRTMEVPADEVDELLENGDIQANNLDSPDAAFDIDSWVETAAIKQG